MKVALPFILILAALAAPLSGQNLGQVRGEDQLKRLDTQLEIARDLLRQFPNKQAEQLIQMALENRAEAISLFSKNRPTMAMVRFNTALNLVNQAINMLSVVPLERIREQVHDLEIRVEQVTAGVRNKEVERLLKDAKNNIRAASKDVAGGNIVLAIEKYRVAKFLLERLLNLTSAAATNPLELLRSENERFEELMHQAEEVVAGCDNPQARQLFVLAQKQYKDLRQAYANGDSKIALNLYYNATRLLLRAIDLCHGVDVPVRERAIEAMNSLNEFAALAAEQQSAMSNRNRMIMDKVKNLQQQAQRAINQGNYDLAIRRIELARNLINRLLGFAESPDLSNRAEQELQRLLLDIEHTESGLESMDKRSKKLLNAARRSARDAQRYLGQNRILPALESILTGNRFLSAIGSAPSTAEIGETALAEKIHNLSDRIQELRRESTGENRDLLELARRMIENASEALQNKELEIAEEYTRVTESLLNKIEQQK